MPALRLFTILFFFLSITLNLVLSFSLSLSIQVYSPPGLRVIEKTHLQEVVTPLVEGSVCISRGGAGSARLPHLLAVLLLGMQELRISRVIYGVPHSYTYITCGIRICMRHTSSSIHTRDVAGGGQVLPAIRAVQGYHPGPFMGVSQSQFFRDVVNIWR